MHTTSQLLRLYLKLCETLSDLHTFSLMNFSLLLQSDHVVLCLNLIIWKAFNQETSNDIPTQNYIFFLYRLIKYKNSRSSHTLLLSLATKTSMDNTLTQAPFAKNANNNCSYLSMISVNRQNLLFSIVNHFLFLLDSILEYVWCR